MTDDLTYEGEEHGEPEEIREDVKFAGGDVDVPHDVEERVSRERDEEGEAIDG